MEIYTTYFARVASLPSTIEPVAICLFPVQGWNHHVCRQLAPIQVVFTRYKQSHNFEEFAEDFIETTLSNVTFEGVMRRLTEYADGKDVALVCYEKNPYECHRSIVAEWFRFNGIPVTEWQPNKQKGQ